MRRYCATPGCSTVVDRGHCQQHAVVREHQRVNFDVRRWYRTVRWKILRRSVLMDQPICPECERAGEVVPATEVDHIVPHRGDAVLFWDKANLQGLCHQHHGAKTGRGE